MEKTITHTCINCNKEFEVYLRFIKSKKKHGAENPYSFCSRQCYTAFKIKQRTTLTCATCNKEFTRAPVHVTSSGRNKSNRNFCSRSCAVTYNNTHKTQGTRRSKLETYLELQLRAEFPNLELICNGKGAIDSELDFYFPQLRLAIELNGIFHYEPIYGNDKLEQVQRNDQQKSIACNAAGIEFCTIDTSTVTHTTSLVKERYWTIVRDLVVPLLGRADNANMQAP